MNRRLFICIFALLLVLLCACGTSAHETETEPTPTPPEELQLGSLTISSDARRVDLTDSGATLEELFSLSDRLSGLEEIELGLTDADMAQISAVEQAYPAAAVHWRVAVPGGEIDSDSESVDFSAASDGDAAQLVRALGVLPRVKTVLLAAEGETTALSFETLGELAAAAPEAELDCRFELFGQTADWTTEKLKYYKTEIGDEGIDEFRRALPYLRALKLLRLEDCGITDHDAMAALRDDFPQTNVVWNVYIAGYSFMTDTTLINAAILLNDKNAEMLKYFHDVLYLDIGHNHTLTNIEFVRNFPKLQVVILTLTNITDITPLEDCPDIEFLEMVSTPIYSIDVVAGMEKLEYLNLGCMWNLSDISPAYGLKSLKNVRICGTTFTHVKWEQVDELEASLPDCFVSTYGGDPTKSGNWRFNDDGSYTERYALLREQMRYDLVNWKLMLSNSPSGEED